MVIKTAQRKEIVQYSFKNYCGKHLWTVFNSVVQLVECKWQMKHDIYHGIKRLYGYKLYMNCRNIIL
jgi:hypothetical protein